MVFWFIRFPAHIRPTVSPTFGALRFRCIRLEAGWVPGHNGCGLPLHSGEGGKKGSGINDLNTLEVVCQELGIELWELLKPDFEIPGEEDEKIGNRTEEKPPCGL